MNNVGNTSAKMALHFKDEILDRLASRANVAQFVSFGPALEQRFARVHGHEANETFDSLRHAITILLSNSTDRSVNVRSFQPDDPKSREFIYGITNVDEVEASVRRLAAEGLYTIINETIDVCDGGVSGVLLSGMIEFAPCDTPRAVEKPGTLAMPLGLGKHLFQTIYGFEGNLDYPAHERVEFSVHPLRRGYLNDHTIVWELEDVGVNEVEPDVRWPNRFSRFIGDKAFGLLMADLLGLPVPETTVIGRNVAPFSFGRPTGSAEVWIRTCPTVQVPGKFTTQRGWRDPFKLMNAEDPEGTDIASVLRQAGVQAEYSGALVVAQGENGNEERVTIEGTRGFGEEFMTGRKAATELPAEVKDLVRDLYEKARVHLGPVRMEWVADQDKVWVVQLHRGATKSSGSVVYPGDASSYHRFKVERGLEELRQLISEVRGTDQGVILVGDVGVTSHFGDVLRRAEIPSKIESASVEHVV